MEAFNQIDDKMRSSGAVEKGSTTAMAGEPSSHPTGPPLYAWQCEMMGVAVRSTGVDFKEKKVKEKEGEKGM